MKKLLILVLSALATSSAAVPTVNSGQCDQIDRDGETVMRTITFDLEAERVCSGAGCSDHVVVRDGNSAYMFFSIDEASRMRIYYIPGNWNRDEALGYVHYSGNNKPYFLKNCRMP